VGIKFISRMLTCVGVITALFTTTVFAFDVIDESVTWPKVAQGHHQNNNNSCHKINNPQLSMQGSSRINGTLGADLAYCSNNSGSGLPNNSCDTASGGDRFCTVTGSDTRGLSFSGNNAFKTSNGAGGGVGSCTANQNISLGDTGQNQFSSIALNSACTVTLSSTQQEYRFQSIAAENGAKLVFPAGDYWINSLTLNQNAQIVVQGNARIFIGNNTELNGAKVNETNTHSLQLIAYKNLSLTSGAIIGGRVYSDETLTIDGNSIINGRVTSRYLSINSNGQINDASVAVPFHIQYGKATSASISFTTAFPTGVTPLVFLMPTVSQTNTNNDGPASALLGNVTAQEFTWSKQEPESPTNQYIPSNNMPEVHWIAVTPGNYDLPNGTKLIAGSVNYNQALFGSNSPYTPVTLPASQDVLLNQIQTRNNNCWFTSTSQFTSTGIELALDTSEVRDNSARCQPGGLNNSQIQNETIGYLSLKSGSGAMVLAGENTNYHFGKSQTFTASGVQDLAYQCGFTTSLIGFSNIPVLVAGKNSRNGGDGGWLRRCQLTNSLVSMVDDEDTYQNADRRHISENYSFVAIERLTKVRQCFTDDFQRSSVGNDWVVSNSGGGFTPSIVNNRLRVTQAAGNQATSSTYQRLFPAANNLVEIEFDHYAYGGSGADGIAFVLSDAAVTPQAGAFGGPLGYGYKSGINGFAGGWLGFGIDEYGNFSTEGGPNGPGRRQQSVVVRGSGSGTSGYPYLRGSCNNGTTNTAGNCLSPTVDNNNVTPAHRYRITIDSKIAGQSIVKVERNSGSGFIEIIPAFNAAAILSQAAVPLDFLLSLTGSTGGSTNNHEIDNVEICALDSRPIGVVIDHFEFTHSGSGLTCGPETLTLKACANADCSQTVPDFVTATLSPATVTGGGGWVGGNVVSFSGGATTLQLNRNTVGTVVVDVTGSTPGAKPFSQTLCRIAGSAASAANCTLTFADSGFIFDVPDKLANKPAPDIVVSAVKKSDITKQCIPSFANVSKNVAFWSTYTSPSVPINGQSVSVNGTNVGNTSATATNIALAFDALGQAKIAVNYPDAGQLQLDARYTGTGTEQGLTMLGNDPFVSFPVGLCITPQDTGTQCVAGNSSCSVYKKAGESFNLLIQGKAWNSDADLAPVTPDGLKGRYCNNINLNTPNYVHNSIALGSNVEAPSVISGGVQGAVSNISYNHVAQTTNTNTVSQSISEVGVFTFSAKALSSYLGSSFYNIPLAQSVNIGRFVPDRFVVDSVSVLPACGVFSYMDQPFLLSMDITAYNTFSSETKNYQAGFAKGTAQLVGENSNNGTELSNRLSSLPVNAASWVAGVASVDASYRAKFARTTAPNVDGPFSALDIGVQVFDNDTNIAFVADPDMRADTAGNCTTPSNTCNAKRITTQDLRHGRVTMDNTYGPENEILRMPTYAQYWNGSQWVVNVGDSCSIINGSLSGTEIYTPAKVAGQTVTRTNNSTNISVGKMTLFWQNTGTNNYRGQVQAPAQVDSWLQWYWNYDTSSVNLLVNPQASAFFGRYRGHDRIIYWEEVRQ
jgi:MSHA biogenesis protein MshQ